GKLCRHDDVYRDVKIAASRSAAFGDTTPPDSERRTGLRSARNSKLLLVAINGWNRDLRAESRLRVCNWNVAIKVVFASFEKLMLLDAQDHIEVTGWSALCASITFACHS